MAAVAGPLSASWATTMPKQHPWLKDNYSEAEIKALKDFLKQGLLNYLSTADPQYTNTPPPPVSNVPTTGSDSMSTPPQPVSSLTTIDPGSTSTPPVFVSENNEGDDWVDEEIEIDEQELEERAKLLASGEDNLHLVLANPVSISPDAAKIAANLSSDLRQLWQDPKHDMKDKVDRANKLFQGTADRNIVINERTLRRGVMEALYAFNTSALAASVQDKQAEQLIREFVVETAARSAISLAAQIHSCGLTLQSAVDPTSKDTMDRIIRNNFGHLKQDLQKAVEVINNADQGLKPFQAAQASTARDALNGLIQSRQNTSAFDNHIVSLQNVNREMTVLNEKAGVNSVQATLPIEALQCLRDISDESKFNYLFSEAIKAAMLQLESFGIKFTLLDVHVDPVFNEKLAKYRREFGLTSPTRIDGHGDTQMIDAPASRNSAQLSPVSRDSIQMIDGPVSRDPVRMIEAPVSRDSAPVGLDHTANGKSVEQPRVSEFNCPKVSVPGLFPSSDKRITPLGKIDCIQSVGRGYRVIVNIGTDDFAVLQSVPGSHFGRGVIAKLYEQFPMEGLSKDNPPSAADIQHVLHMVEVSGHSQREPITLFLVKLTSGTEGWLTRSALIKITGKEFTEDARNTFREARVQELAVLQRAREARMVPFCEEPRPLTADELAKQPWLGKGAFASQSQKDVHQADTRGIKIGRKIVGEQVW